MKKVMVCFDLNKYCYDLFKSEFQNWKWEDTSEVHLVHCLAQQIYADNFLITPFPATEQLSEVEKSVLGVLNDFSTSAGLENGPGQVIKKFLVSSSPKSALVEYAKEQGIDKMWIGTRGLHGVKSIFHSSFAEYMVRHAPCEVRVLRHLENNE